jgi:phospholipase C
MMENRSFDHMLGFLASPDFPIDGLTGNETNPNSQKQQVPVTDRADFAGGLTPDPGHHFPDVNMQIFGNYEATDDGGPKMQGFVTSYEQHTQDVKKAARIMDCFSPDKVPVLSTLAREYAVCDRWFASVPGPTLPNRSFMHSATSIGRVDMSPIWRDETTTIYELLNKFGVGAKIYYHDWSVAMTFKMLSEGQSKWFCLFDDFLTACKKNTLPAYSFIEPRYNAQDAGGQAFEANDQHPDHNVANGEQLISDVYNAIRNNKDTWESTMLVIIYDEHGGLYDHVTPPATVNPDGKIAADPGENVAKIPPFDFTRLGVRVPAVIVSPYIKQGTIESTIYDHTSIIATARKLFLGTNADSNFLTERDRHANSFEHVLTLTEARTDTVKFQKFEEVIQPMASASATDSLNKPLSTHQQMIVQHAYDMEQRLPAGRRSGLTPDLIKTERQASAYLAQVTSELRRSAAEGEGAIAV